MKKLLNLFKASETIEAVSGDVSETVQNSKKMNTVKIIALCVLIFLALVFGFIDSATFVELFKETSK